MLSDKYRRKKFSEISGNKLNINTFTNIIRKDLNINVLILSGIPGSGKTTMARIFLKAINCLNPKEDLSPCEECEACKSDLDSYEFDIGAINNLDYTKEIKEISEYKPILKKKLTLLIDECDNFSNASWSTLLKCTEDLKKNVIFVFCTSKIEKLPDSIISRSLVISCDKIYDKNMFHLLKQVSEKECINVSDSILERISFVANGSVREAYSILNHILVADEKHLTEIYQNYFLVSNEEIEEILQCKNIHSLNKTVLHKCQNSNYIRNRLLQYFEEQMVLNPDRTRQIVNKATYLINSLSTKSINYKNELSIRILDLNLESEDKIISLLSKLYSLKKFDLVNILLSNPEAVKYEDGRYIFNNSDLEYRIQLVLNLYE